MKQPFPLLLWLRLHAYLNKPYQLVMINQWLEHFQQSIFRRYVIYSLYSVNGILFMFQALHKISIFNLKTVFISEYIAMYWWIDIYFCPPMPDKNSQ